MSERMVYMDFYPEVTDLETLEDIAEAKARETFNRYDIKIYGGFRDGQQMYVKYWPGEGEFKTPEWMHAYLNNKENPQVGGILL